MALDLLPRSPAPPLSSLPHPLQWTVGLGYTAADYQAALLFNDKQTGAFRVPVCVWL